MTCLEKKVTELYSEYRMSICGSCDIESIEYKIKEHIFNIFDELYYGWINQKMSCLNSGHLCLQCEGKCDLLIQQETPIELDGL